MASERLKTTVWIAVLIAGALLSFGRGQLPQRDSEVARGSIREVAPDLALYGDVIAEVRAGRDYYEVAREKIPQYGFPIVSPLNWRLPTYAWLLSRLPNKCWIQAVLLALAVGGMWLTFVAERRRSSVLQAGVTTFLMFGVMRWTFDGLAYLAQEPWAAVLVAVSLAAGTIAACAGRGGQGEGETRRGAWRAVSVAAGTLALLFRELALPYCLVAGAMAAWKRRRVEAAGWVAGIAIFVILMAWHVGQVHEQLAGLDVERVMGRESLAGENAAVIDKAAPPKTPDPLDAAGGGIAQWLRFGGLDFVLLTTRMNSLLFTAPAWLLWLYLLVALLGLSRGRDETSQTACGTALLYVLAFAIVGRPENFYWGLLPAPLLVWGGKDGAMAVAEMVRGWCLRNATASVAYRCNDGAAIENGGTPRV